MRTLKPPDPEIDAKVKGEPPDGIPPDSRGKEVRLEGFGPVLLYSEPSGEDGVRVHLRDDKSLLSRLHNLPLHDLPDPNIDLLLSTTSPVESSSEESKGEKTSTGTSTTNRKASSKATSPNRQGPQRCPVCSKVFGNASALAKHKLTHSDERRYVCTMCAKAFKRQDHLNGHMLTHRNKKPYECKAEGCGKSYCDARSLRRHTENHHSSSGSNSTTPEPSPPTCIQYAPPPPKEQKPLPKPAVMASKPVECNLCHRKFKNIPALNGHMRLHGGYFKKENEPRRFDRRELNRGPLQTASISVRALIEEKIILKRITKPASTNTSSSPSTSKTDDNSDIKIKKEEEEPPDRPPDTDHQIIRKVPKFGVKRTSSDPGLIKQPDSLDLQNGNRSFSIDDYNDNRGILSPSLQEQVFPEGDESVLLEGVDTSSLEESINAADLDDLTIDEYNSPGECLASPHTFQHHQDVQSVLDSPLPANLADFAYVHSQENMHSQDHSQSYSSSTLPASTLNYPSSPISRSSISSHTTAGRVSSTSSSYYSPNITSTSGAVDSTLLPSCTPMPSSTQGSTLQSQMMPNSEDPLLSSSPRDFPRKRFDFPTKTMQGSSNERCATNQGLNGIMVDQGGELKLITTTPSQSVKQTQINSGNYTTIKSETGTKMLKAPTSSNKSTFMKNNDKIGSGCILGKDIKEETDDDIFATPSLSMTPVHMMRKRSRMESSRQTIIYQSRLRTVRKSYGSTTFHYTPPPILPPSRLGTGLYWMAATASPSSTTLSKGYNWEENSDVPESDSRPHINIGAEYQCVIPDLYSAPAKRDKVKDHLVWDSKLTKILSDTEVDKYLELACCAAVPGGGRNKEHALHLLHICQGSIQDAILQLMQPMSWLPVGHPLLTFQYNDTEAWKLSEMESFYRALLKYDKDFSLVAREVVTKNVKECVQFYYMWKKVCPDDYRRLRIVRKRARESEFDNSPSRSDTQSGDTDIVTTTSSEGRLFVCEYSDCSASFNSRAALNGHIRIHVGGRTGRCTPDKRNGSHGTDSTDYPCKLCGKQLETSSGRRLANSAQKRHVCEEMRTKTRSSVTENLGK